MRNCGKMIIIIMFCLIGSYFVVTCNSALAATSGSHYPFGGEGVMAASAPPPGFHYRIYNTWYNPTTLKDDNGDEVPVDFNLDIFSTVHRFVHITKKKIFGADYGYNVIVTLVSKDIEIGGVLSDSQSLAVGDIVIEPMVLAWHTSRWDAALGLAVIMPTGEYDSDKAASVGLGYWSGMLTLGVTYYFDEAKTWSISALTRTLVNTEQQDTNVTPGSEFVVEYGIGKQMAVTNSLLVRPGIAGAAYWQISDDSEDGPNGSSFEDERKQSCALGGEINFLYLPWLFQTNIRVLREFDARNNVEGSQCVLTLTKSW